MPDSSADFAVFAALGIAVFEPTRPGFLSLSGPAPAWLRGTPGVSVTHFSVEDTFPFLSGFLLVAREFWRNEESAPLFSDIWVQPGAEGNELALRARAILFQGRPLLLIERLEEEYEERRDVLQRSRQKGLDNERLERTAQELSAAAFEARRTMRGKNEFFAGMSHDLKTPLNALLGFSKLLLQGRAGEINPKQRAYLEHINRAGYHLLDLVNDVLDLSRIEAGQLELRCEDCLFEETLQDVLATVLPLAHARGITIETAQGEHRIYADRTRLRQILYNLLSNAIKFTGRNGWIAVSAGITGEWFTVCVSDNGQGIDPADHNSIFERYFQTGQASQGDRSAAGDSTGDHFEGSGLGLAITRQLIHQHGGSIRVESALGEGSRFIFRLPARPRSAAAEG